MLSTTEDAYFGVRRVGFSTIMDYLVKLHATRTFWVPPSKMVLGPHTGVELNVRHFVEPYTALRTTA